MPAAPAVDPLVADEGLLDVADDPDVVPAVLLPDVAELLELPIRAFVSMNWPLLLLLGDDDAVEPAVPLVPVVPPLALWRHPVNVTVEFALLPVRLLVCPLVVCAAATAPASATIQAPIHT